MIGLAARLAVSGGRESLIRLALTAVGVAIGTTMLLVAAAAEPAIRAHQQHTAWQYTLGDPAALEGDGDPLLWLLTSDRVDGRELTVLRVAATGPTAPAPLGLDHVPAPGEVHASPALVELLEELPADRLGDRFPAAPSGTIADDHLAGPDDLVAVVGGTTTQLERAGAVEVYDIRTRPARFQFTDVLRLVLGIGAVGLLMPVVVFVATSTRIGAARREQRFAALRLAGATARQTTVVAGFEAGVAAVAGTILGIVGFAVARPYAARIEIDGHESFLADLAVPPPLFALIIVAIPALAVTTATVSLRRLQISPLGVARRAPRPRPTVRRLVPFVAGSAAFAASYTAAIGRSGAGMLIPVMVSFGVMIYGIVAAGPWLTVLTARLLRRVAPRACVLLAGRRLEDDPASGFRAVSGLVLAVFVASVFSGVTPSLLQADRADTRLFDSTTMTTGLPTGTSGAQGDAVLEAALSAGAGDGVVLHEDPVPDRPLADPATGRGHTVVASCTDLDIVAIDRSCPAGTTVWVDLGIEEAPTEPSPYTPEDVAAMPAELVAVTTDGTTATTDRVRTAMQQAAPGAMTFLAAEADAEANRELIELNRLANLALVVTLVIAGCGLAVAVAAGVIERKQPFTLLRLAGMHLGELQRSALLEATAPLLLIALATATLGLATSAVIIGLTGGGLTWQPPSVGYWLSLAGGLAAATAAAASALPLLSRTTAPSAARFE